MNIVIAGYGIEGKSSASYFERQGHVITIIDENEVILDGDSSAHVQTGVDIFSQLDSLELTPDMVVRTAGLAPHKLKTSARIWSATNEFFKQCPAPIIGVTGSKGKGTTCSLIASILRAAGKNVHLVGNIGVPALDVLPSIKPTDVVVYELSSFQLWDAEYSPHIAVILHIEPDHLDVHASFEEYLAAKSKIVAFQSRNDICLYHPTNKYSEHIAKSQPQFATHAAKYGINQKDNANVETVYVKSGRFTTSSDHDICSVGELRIPGKHNIDNAAAAIAACLNFDDEITNQAVVEGLNGFTGLPHRLKFVDEINGVQYYDDSIATTPGSAVAAVESFTQPKLLILGGSSKGADFDILAQAITDAKIRHILLIGAEAKRIALELDSEHFTHYTIIDTSLSMGDIVDYASQLTQPGDVVVLSPACASFGMFKNYSDRGDQFIAGVERLKKGRKNERN
jgi:UDP-N-acetylmuramoylalanine--D-glutamate ligase